MAWGAITSMKTIKRQFLDSQFNVVPTFFDAQITAEDVLSTFTAIRNEFLSEILFEDANSFTVLFENVSIKYMQIIIS